MHFLAIHRETPLKVVVHLLVEEHLLASECELSVRATFK